MTSSSDLRKTSRRIAVAAAFLLGAFVPTAQAGDALDAIQARYDGVRDMRADFEQTSYMASLGKESSSEGSVLVERPGKMRWEYGKPDGRVIVLDGETIRIYDPSDKQLQIATLVEGGVNPTALSFLMGDGVLGEMFDAKPIDAKERKELGLRLTPKDGDQSFESLELWVDAKTHQMRESRITDLFGNKTTLRFKNVVENNGAKKAEFEVTVPEGTEILDLR